MMYETYFHKQLNIYTLTFFISIPLLNFQSVVGVSVIGQLTNNCILCLNKLPAFSVGPVKSDIVLNLLQNNSSIGKNRLII